jgi:hypothetical protein
MKNSGLRMVLAGAVLAALGAWTSSAHADPLPTPPLAGPLSANPNPFSIDLPDWLGDAGGKVYIGGAVTGLAFWQSSPIDINNGDDASFVDISNAQVFIQKTDGWLQFYAQYSKTWNWISGLVSYGFNGGADTVVFSAGGNLGKGNFSFLNSGSVYDLIWTHTSGPWVISPYIQYNVTPKVFFGKGSTVFGGAVLASYAFDDHWKLAGRVEYESESGHAGVFTTPDIIGYGPGSNAWSVTLTPTYQWKQLFARADVSYVTVGSGTPGFLFGSGPFTAGTNKDQVRLMFETGVLF